MRTTGWALLLLGLLSAGCFQLPVVGHATKKEPPPPPVTKAAPAHAPVSPEQVNEANARSKAAALQEELDQAAQETDPVPAPPAPHK